MMKRWIALPLLAAFLLLAVAACQNNKSSETPKATSTGAVQATNTSPPAPTDTPVPPEPTATSVPEQPTQPPVQPTTQPANCDPSYPDVCIPPPPPDLDCGDISFRRFRVLPPDPHRFDADHDGIGCESG